MLHDVNYALANGDPLLLRKADDMALSRLRFADPKYWLMRVGLKTRQQLHMFENPTDKYTESNLRDMKLYLLNSSAYRPFKIHSEDFVK